MYRTIIRQSPAHIEFDSDEKYWFLKSIFWLAILAPIGFGWVSPETLIWAVSYVYVRIMCAVLFVYIVYKIISVFFSIRQSN